MLNTYGIIVGNYGHPKNDSIYRAYDVFGIRNTPIRHFLRKGSAPGSVYGIFEHFERVSS